MRVTQSCSLGWAGWIFSVEKQDVPKGTDTFAVSNNAGGEFGFVRKFIGNPHLNKKGVQA